MGIVVQKFGGSSVANTEKLINVCNTIKSELNEDNQVVVVVSAQGKKTDELIKEEMEITESASKREHDVLVAVGEQITISKLCMCLDKMKIPAVSLLGWQLPIITDSVFGDANIKSIGTQRIKNELTQGKVVVVAGFQGIDEHNNITTLGRGGSDTTAVAIAAWIKANRCDIYTDVDGVYSDDPNVKKDAIKFEILSYDEMLKMANNGAKVLHNKSVAIAKEYIVPVIVKSSFNHEAVGTLITNI